MYHKVLVPHINPRESWHIHVVTPSNTRIETGETLPEGEWIPK